MTQCHHCEAKPEFYAVFGGEPHCLSCLADEHRSEAVLLLDNLVNFKGLKVPRPGRAAAKR